MDIDKALNHFKWKFKNHWKPTKKDIEAYNSILDFKEHRQSVSLSENELLAKLWIHQLMLLNTSNLYSAERSIQVIDEILSKSVYDWVLRLKDQTDIMRFNASLSDENYIDAVRHGNITKMREIGSKLINKEYSSVINKANNKTKEENIIKFVEQQINRIINKY